MPDGEPPSESAQGHSQVDVTPSGGDVELAFDDDGAALAAAWRFKDRCYAAWSSDPRAAVAAAEDLQRLRLQAARASSDSTLAEIDALEAWTSGIAGLIRGDMAAAVLAFDAAAADFEGLGQPLHAAQTQVPKIMALTMLGHHDAAVRCAEAAQHALLAHGDMRAASKVALNLGNTMVRRDRFAEALSHFEKASTWFASLHDHEHGVMADIGLGHAHAALGRPREAARVYALALANARGGGFSVLQAIAHESMAHLDLSRGRFREALAGLERARRAYEELDMPQQLAIVERCVAETYLELRLLPEALAGADAVLRRFESLGMEVDRAWTLLQQGRALAMAGNHGLAKRSLDLGATSFAQQGNVQGAAFIDLARAELALLGGQDSEALRSARSAIDDFGTAGQVAPRLRAQCVAAKALLQLHDPASARMVFDAVLEQARTHELLPTQLTCLTGRGMAARALGDAYTARQDLEAAAALSRELGITLPDDGIRSAYLSDHLVVFRELLRLTLDEFELAGNLQGADNPQGADTPQGATAVLVQLERFRARALADRLDGGGVDDADTRVGSATATTASTATTSAMRDSTDRGRGDDTIDSSEARLAWLHRRFQRMRNDAEASSNLEVQIRATERELLDRARRARLSATPRSLAGPELVEGARPERVEAVRPERVEAAIDAPLDTQALRNVLQPGDALVEYGVLDDELFAIVVTPSAVTVIRRLASWQRVLDVVRWTRFQLESPRFGAVATQRHAPALQHRASRRLRELHGLIWAPLEPTLGASRRVLVVPQAQLGTVPFAALHDGRQSLVDRHEIAMAPSARIALRGLARPPRGVRSVLALGESSRLPHARNEALSVAAMLPEGRACIDADATIDALRTYGEHADVIHFACHAQFRADNPMFSAIHLHDGPLTARAIESMRVRSALVVLSACETALYSEHGGDEIFGITRAFLVAGAERVVASLCSVDDAAAARTMIAFYGGLNEGASSGAAMRAAQLAVRDHDDHPYYWATFALIGGW